MISKQDKGIADRAQQIYAERLQSELEAKHRNQYVAIEPESGEYFVADSFSRAVATARKTHPHRISFVIRIGHEAALHLGGMSN